MDENKGHFCYGCNEYFHESNPKLTIHKDCKGKKSLGVCVDKREFSDKEREKFINGIELGYYKKEDLVYTIQ